MQVSDINKSYLQIQPKMQKENNINKVPVSQLKSSAAGAFAEILKDTCEETSALHFSKHAAMRLKSRDIQFSSEQLERINDGLIKAKQKGIKDSLVLVDNIALVVNTKNNVVVTAMEQDSENIYTNIDGAVVV